MPTINYNKGDEEDSDHEERVSIAKKPIETIAYVRRIIKVNEQMIPATISLIGCEGKYFLGMKVTMYDPMTASENGFFLTIN